MPDLTHRVGHRFLVRLCFALLACIALVGVQSTSAQSRDLECIQKCPGGSEASRKTPDDGKHRCECSCTRGGARCSVRAVGHSDKAKPGQAGSIRSLDGSSFCSMECPKNECLETTTDLKGVATCFCFECSELDPK